MLSKKRFICHCTKFYKLLETSMCSDVTLQVHDSRDETVKLFHVHRAILATQSEPFHVMFTSDFCESNSNVVEVKGVSTEAFEKAGLIIPFTQ